VQQILGQNIVFIIIIISNRFFATSIVVIIIGSSRLFGTSIVITLSAADSLPQVLLSSFSSLVTDRFSSLEFCMVEESTAAPRCG
jgi:hypothetical protein